MLGGPDPHGIFDDDSGLVIHPRRSGMDGVEHFVHAACILCLFLDLHRLHMRALVLVTDLINLVFKKFIVVALLIIDYTANQQQHLQDYALHPTVESARLVAVLSLYVPHAQKHQSHSTRYKVSSCEVVKGLENQRSVKLAEEQPEAH
jgi:hypothetical protein